MFAKYSRMLSLFVSRTQRTSAGTHAHVACVRARVCTWIFVCVYDHSYGIVVAVVAAVQTTTSSQRVLRRPFFVVYYGPFVIIVQLNVAHHPSQSSFLFC